MNWKNKFIISWMNKKAGINEVFNANFGQLPKDSKKYKFWLLVKERFLDNASNFIQNYFHFIIKEVNKELKNKLTKEDWKNEDITHFDILKKVETIIYKIINLLGELEKSIKEKNEVKQFDNLEELKIEVDRIKLIKEKKQLQEIYNEEEKDDSEEEDSEVPKIVFSYIIDGNKFDVYMPKTIEQLSYIGRGTNWCFGEDYITEIGEDSVISYYNKIKDGYPLYVIYANNYPYVAIHEESNQWLNIEDKELDLEQYNNIMPVIEKFHIYSILYDLYNKNIIDKEYIDKYLPVIIRNAKLAYEYAKNCIKGRWPQDVEYGIIAEKTIAKNKNILREYIDFLGTFYSYKNKTELLKIINKYKSYYNLVSLYPKVFLKEDVEYYLDEICKDSEVAYKYIEKLKLTFEKVSDEKKLNMLIKSIAQNSKTAYYYAMVYIGGRWPQDNEIGKIAEGTIAKDAYYAYEYAFFAFKEENNKNISRWPQDCEAGKIAEMNIAKNNEIAYKYAKNCIKGRWPQDCEAGKVAEMTIAKNNEIAYKYAKFCIKGRWPQDCEAGKIFEQNMAQDTTYAYCYAVNHIKERWPIESGLREIAEQNIAKNIGKLAHYRSIFDIKYDELSSYCEELENENCKTVCDAYIYALNVIGGRWPQNKYGIIAEYNIANSEIAYDYADNCIKDRWPQYNVTEINGEQYNIRKIAENSISKNAKNAYEYAYKYLGRWPQNETYGVIAENNILKSNYFFDYALKVLKSRWPACYEYVVLERITEDADKEKYLKLPKYEDIYK